MSPNFIDYYAMAGFMHTFLLDTNFVQGNGFASVVDSFASALTNYQTESRAATNGTVCTTIKVTANPKVALVTDAITVTVEVSNLRDISLEMVKFELAVLDGNSKVGFNGGVTDNDRW